MPYLGYLYCDKCGPPANMDIDYIATINAYVEEGRSSANIDDRTMLWDYIIYSCRGCGGAKKMTYRDVEERVREYLVSRSEEYASLVENAESPRKDLRRNRVKDMYEK